MPIIYRYPDKPAAWNERDALLFACSIGCLESELQYLYVRVTELLACGAYVLNMRRSSVPDSPHFRPFQLC